MQQPKLLSKVWAALGLKNDIPDSRKTGIPNESATYEEGFPQITMTPIALGGKAPSGKDMNGILNELSAHTVYQNQGGVYKFDSAFAEKIGGYSKGSLLINNKLDKLFISLVDKNKTDFNSQDFSGKWEVVSGVNFFVPKTQKATLQETGIVKLYSGYDSDAEDLAATPKAIKTLKAFIDAITRNITNYIPNSKKSSAIDSNSADDVATSAAAKTAYDKGVEAKNAANNAQRSADDGINRANNAQRSANDGINRANNAQQTAEAANRNANNRVAKSGDTMTGNLVIDSQSNAWSGVALKNKQNKYLVYEVTPDSESYFGSMIYRDGAGHNINHLRLPKRNGEIALKEDIDGKVSKSGDTMTGPLNINFGDYSLINQFNLSGKFARIEVTPDDQSNFYKLSYWDGNSELHSALLPKRGPWKVVAYEDWVNNGYVPRTGDTLINGRPTFENNGGFITIKSTGVSWAAIDYKVWNSPVPLVTTQAEDLGNFSGAFNIFTTPEGTDYNTDRRQKTAQIHHNGRIWSKRYGWLDEQFALAGDTHKKSRSHNHWFPSHYAGTEVVDLPVNDAGGIRITWMGVKLPNYQPPYVDIYLPMAYSGFAKATVSDDGGATFSYGAEMIGNNIVRVYCKQSVAIGFNLQVIGWASF